MTETTTQPQQENQTNTTTQKTNKYDKLLIITIAITAILHIYMFSQLQHVASPIFGGDLYRERGFIQYILNGNPYWTDPYFKGELEFYPPIGYLLGAAIAKITRINIDTIINFFPLFITAFITTAFYKLGQEIFKKKQHAFFLALTGLTHQLFPVKHTYGLALGFAIMFLTYFFKLEHNNSAKTKIYAGLYLGLTALTHYQPFLYVNVMTGTIIILEYIRKCKTEKQIIKTTTETIKKYTLTFFIAFAIAMIFFAPLITKYQMKTLNKTQEYSQFDTNKNGFGWLFTTIYQQFIQTTTLPNFAIGMLAILGLILCILNRNKTEQRYTLYLFAGIIISGGHFLITKPLFNAWIVPSHMMAGIFISTTIFSTWGLKFLQAIIEQKKPAISKYIMPAIILTVIIPILTFSITNYNNDRWINYGRQMDAGTQTLYEMSEWILKNTNNKDVFLANDESAFAINALTGRWVVAARRTHASPYVDVDKRYADAIVMLYGNNTATTKELLKKYTVSHVYIDQYLMSQPIITSTRFTNYLKENGVQFTTQNVRLDPSDINTPTYESIVAMPQTLKITENNLTMPIKQFNAGNQPYSIIYKVNQQ